MTSPRIQNPLIFDREALRASAHSLHDLPIYSIVTVPVKTMYEIEDFDLWNLPIALSHHLRTSQPPLRQPKEWSPLSGDSTSVTQ